MSWFRRKPKIKEPQKHFPHHRRSPISEKMLEEAKLTGPNKDEKEQLKNR